MVDIQSVSGLMTHPVQGPLYQRLHPQEVHPHVHQLDRGRPMLQRASLQQR
jgi:hypothetical protein